MGQGSVSLPQLFYRISIRKFLYCIIALYLRLFALGSGLRIKIVCRLVLGTFLKLDK